MPDATGLTLTTVNLGAPDPVALGHFYQQLLGWDVIDEEPDWILLRPRSGGVGLSVQLETVYTPPTWPSEPDKQQMMLHLEMRVDDLEAAVAHATAVGATLAEYQPQDEVRVCLDHSLAGTTETAESGSVVPVMRTILHTLVRTLRARSENSPQLAGPPAWRWVLTNAPVDGLAEQVGVPGVAAVLLDQVAHQPTQASLPAVGPGDVHELVESTAGQGRLEPPSGAGDPVIPERIQLLRGVVDSGCERPLVRIFPALGVPGRSNRLAAHLGGEHVVLHGRQVFDQAAEGERRGADTRTQPLRVEPVGLPPERRTQPFQCADEVLGVGPGDRWLPRGLGHGQHGTEGCGRALAA